MGLKPSFAPPRRRDARLMKHHPRKTFNRN